MGVRRLKNRFILHRGTGYSFKKPFAHQALAYDVGSAKIEATLNDAASVEIVPAVSGKEILVLSLSLVAGANTAHARFINGTDSTAASGTWRQIGTADITLDWCPCGWFKSKDGQSLRLQNNGGAASSVYGGMLVYAYLDAS